MLSWLENALQTILDTKTSTIKYVKVFDVNSLVQSNKLAKDELTMTVIYREIPSNLPELASKDRMLMAQLDILALENQKAVVKAVWEDFFDTYNNTFVEDRWVYFGNLVSTGQADNKGAYVMQKWNVSLQALIIDQIANLKDITLTLNSNDYDLENGLFSYDFRIQSIYAEHPTTIYQTLTKDLQEDYLTIGLIDLKDTFIRSILYGGVENIVVGIVDGANSYSFNGKVVERVKSAQAKAFPTIRLTIRRG